MYHVDSATAGRSARVVSMKDIEAIRGTQEQLLAPVITDELTGAEQISAGVVFMPPARMSRVHLHTGTEIVVVCVHGFAATLVGPELRPLFHGPGEFIFIPPGLVHVAVNLSSRAGLVAVECRSDPDFNHDVVLVPELDAAAAAAVADLRASLAAGRAGLPEHWEGHDDERWREGLQHAFAGRGV